MKIGIDARMLGPGYGIGRYVQQLVKNLQEIETEDNFVLFLRKDNWDRVEETANFEKVMADIPWYSLQEQLEMSKVIKKEQVDLMHFPHWNIPIFYTDPFVVTIHDLTMFHYPRPEATTQGRLVYWFKDKIHRLVVKKAIKHSTKIISPSKFTKKDIVDTFNISENKINVTYQAPFDAKTKTDEAEIKKKYDLNKKFALYVGSAYPHKNLESLIKAWSEFKKMYTNDYQLILAGKNSYFYDKLKSSKLYKNTESIRHIGFVEDDELPQLYSLTSAFIFPSSYEGFGLPPLEAMQQGTPVLASDLSCIPEILQDSAFYVDPNSSKKFAESIQKMFEDKQLRSELEQKSKQLLKQYSWQDLAEQTNKIYEEVSK